MTRLVVLLAVVGSAAVSCTYENGGEAAADPTVTEPVATSAPAPAAAAPTTTTTLPPTTRAPVACEGGDPAIPAGARDVSEALGDFDGNGGADLLQVFSTTGSNPWRLRVLLTGSGVIETTLEEPAHLGERARAAGGFDVGGGEGDEIFAVIGQEQSFHEVGMFVLQDCRIEPVRRPGGEPARFTVGQTFRERRGLECRADELVERRAEGSDGRTFTTEEARHQLSGATITETGRQPGATLVSPQADPYIQGFGSFLCGTIGLGPPA